MPILKYNKPGAMSYVDNFFTFKVMYKKYDNNVQVLDTYGEQRSM
jgi:hypothetical protein